MRRAFAAFLVTLAALGAAACSTDAAAPRPTASTVSAADKLAAAKAKADVATSLHLRITSANIGSGVNGVLAADGVGTHAPAFKGTLDARIAGVQAKLDVVAVDGKLYVKLPFVDVYAPTDPAAYNAPDPAKLFATTGGVTSLLTATQAPAFGDRRRQGAEVLQTITGTLPGAVIVDLLHVGDRSTTYQARFGLTSPGDELRTADITGAFFGSAVSTYTVVLDRYGAQVDIRKP